MKHIWTPCARFAQGPGRFCERCSERETPQNSARECSGMVDYQAVKPPPPRESDVLDWGC